MAFTPHDLAKYLPKGYQPKVILDLGAHIGQEATIFHDLYSEAKIYAFECSHVVWPVLIRNLREYPRVVPQYLGVSDQDGTKPFYFAKPHPLWPRRLWASGSMNKFDVGITTQVKSVRLDTWMKEQKLEKADLLWADIQGGELIALQGMGEYVQTLDAILLEVWYRPMTYDNITLLPEMDKWLSDKGFEMKLNVPENDIWGDAIWVRRGLV